MSAFPIEILQGAHKWHVEAVTNTVARNAVPRTCSIARLFRAELARDVFDAALTGSLPILRPQRKTSKSQTETLSFGAKIAVM